MLWDIFCRVIDNHGDLGVCWRLSADLAARGHCVRLWVDDASALSWLAPGALDGTHPAIEVRPWAHTQGSAALHNLVPADVWVEGFGCEIATEFIAAYANSMRSGSGNDVQFPIWINLEYLSAENYVERCHGLPSPILQGPARGGTKHFFYPGFTAGTGGLLREPDRLQRQHAFRLQSRSTWLSQLGFPDDPSPPGERWIALFCYEPAALSRWLLAWSQEAAPIRLLVCAGRARAAVLAALSGWDQPIHASGLGTHRFGNLTVYELPYLSQAGFDELLWACDLNCVRGEDSLVRALWAGKPLLWHIYPQDDGAHHAKLDAFLDWLGADPSLRAAHHAWNSQGDPPPWTEVQTWTHTITQARDTLLAQDDLTTQLLRFVCSFPPKKQ